METKNKSSNKFLNAGIFSAVAASLCCIAPVLAIIGGIGGIASAFSWLEPLRPYLIGLSVISLGAAFYQAYKPKKEVECDCEPARSVGGSDEKPKFINSKKFLWTITIVSAVLLSFPYYSQNLFPKVTTIANASKENIVKANLYIEGMTCKSCEQTIDYSLKTTKGVVSASSSYKTGTAIVEYDKRKANISELINSVNDRTGYKVKNYEISAKQKEVKQ